MKAYRERNPGHKASHHYRHVYGVSVVWFLFQWQLQDGRCAICRLPENGSKRMAVDHNHQTGVARGLLCRQCNTALAAFERTPDFAARCGRYLVCPTVTGQEDSNA